MPKLIASRPHRLLRAIACLTVLGLALPVHAEAQIGGLLKKKIKEKVAGSEPAASAGAATSAPSAASSGPRFGDRVVEIDADVASRLLAALEREKFYGDSVDAFVAKLPTPQAYSECQMKVMQSPEWQKAYDGDKTAEELVALGQKLKVAVSKVCGPDPSEARNAKAEAAQEAPKAGAAAGRFTGAQYDILKERALPYCTTKPASDDGARIPGSGRNIFYVYSAGEVEQLDAHCGELLPLLKALS